MASRAQIPEGWRMVRLGDVAEINRGTSWSREQESPVPADSAAPVLRIGNVQQDGFHMDDVLYIQGVSASDKSRHAIAPRTLVMVGSNGNRDRVGNTFLANDQVKGHLLASFLIGISPVLGTSEHFLVASLRSSQTQSLITESTSGSTGIKNLSLTWLRNLPILLPPLAEQRAIAAVLDAIDEAIERTEAVVAATERLRDALLHELLTRGVPGWHTTWKDAPGIGTIPASWDVVRLGDVLNTVVYGTNVSLRGAGTVPVLRMNNLQDGRVDLSDVRGADLGDEALRDLNLVSGDILFNRTNSLHLVGKVGLVRDLPQPISFASYLVRLRVKEDRANPFWLSSLLGSRNHQARIRRFATPGVSQANVNPTSLKSLLVPLPSLSEQEVGAAMLGSMDDAIAHGRSETDALRSLKASTADALLTGRVRVGNHANNS